MCGIAGYFGEKKLDGGRIGACLGLMRRRGPDSAAFRSFSNPAGRNAYLLHSRLNIIDLNARANQPFGTGGRTIVFNGEIYNYVELRDELRAEGGAFETESDTEVLMEALARRGRDCLDRLEGMWAFALYDERSGSLTLSRDRFGEKPLCLYREPDGLFFASEPKFIMALLGRRLGADTGHLYRFLVNGYKSIYKSRDTFIAGVTDLPRASVLEVDARGRESQSTYWTPRFAPRDEMTYDEAVEGARERLIRSVRLRLRADVPLAFCMSGGVDSNSLISIAKKALDYDVHGFTIIDSDARYQEAENVSAAVRDLGIRHTPIRLDTRDFLPQLRTLVFQHDAPVYTISYYTHWLLMRSVAEHGYRISISGTAADELFTGYYDHHLAYLYEVRGDAGLHAAARAAWERHVRPVVRNPFLGSADAFVEDPGMRSHIFLNADGFAEFLRAPWSEAFTEERYAAGLLRNRMMNEMFHETTPVILHEDDLNAMFYSIENRSPYLDRELFEFCNTIPTRHLIRDGYAKAVLRDAMKGLLPEAIRTCRRKVGFNASILTLLDTSDRSVRETLLDRSPIFEHVRRDKIEALLGKKELPNSESKFLFYFAGAKFFLEEFKPGKIS